MGRRNGTGSELDDNLMSRIGQRDAIEQCNTFAPSRYTENNKKEEMSQRDTEISQRPQDNNDRLISPTPGIRRQREPNQKKKIEIKHKRQTSQRRR